MRDKENVIRAEKKDCNFTVTAVASSERARADQYKCYVFKEPEKYINLVSHGHGFV